MQICQKTDLVCALASISSF